MFNRRKHRVLSVLLAAVVLMTTFCGLMVTPTASAEFMGDLNADGEITTIDARIYMVALLTNTDFTSSQQPLADMNNDGRYSTVDVREILITVLRAAPKEAVRSTWIPYMEVEELLVSLDPATCRKAIDTCLTDCAARGANTVYFHVRANSDAYYDSSVFNPGTKTKALLAKGFDPLECAVELAHAKGMKIEAWVNPYRIGSDVSRAKADATFSYNGRYYYVPSDDAVHTLVVAGVKELVDGYAIDGVQFDDYFYPEGSVSNTAPATFEEADYTAYKNSGGTMSIADWRRAEVNALIADCYSTCHSRSGCVFGISPSYNFEANYDAMYADAATWARTAGYVDYLAPQLYIGFNHVYTPYDWAITQWDNLPRQASVQLVAGLALYKTGLKDDTWAGSTGRYEWLNNDDIMERQIALAKSLNWDGIALYSHQSFVVGSDRDATVAAKENAAACEAWLVFQ